YIDTRNGYANNLRAIPYSIFDFKQKKGQNASVNVVFTRNRVLESDSIIPVGTRVSNGSLAFTTTQVATIQAATKATVKLVFSRSEISGSDLNIPVGTRVSDSSESIVFVTTQAGVIEGGELSSGEIEAQAVDVGSAYNVSANTLTVIQSSLLPDNTSVNNSSSATGGNDGAIESNSVAATAEEVGLKYNVAANTITTIESNLSAEIVGVNNPIKATGGADAETQTQMLNRFKMMINGLQGSNKFGIQAGVLSLNGVRSVGIEEHIPPKQNIYNLTVYVDDGTGRLTDTLKEQVEDVINGTDSEDNPGLRAAGINVEVQPATIVPVTVSVNITIYRAEVQRVKNDVETKLQEYINGLGINENVVLSSIVVLLKQISGITDVTGLTLNGETENIVCGVNAIARFEEAIITVV
ncbi:MAG: baseplate J/gp47 family protein, partial [Treponema sp.]|nr:baseplate J/gp47 family protein [Treponema sp.]